MLPINRTLVLTAAIIAVGLVSVIEVAQSRQPSAAASVAARFPTQSEMFANFKAPAGKAEGESCTREHWPYIADECLTPANGRVQQPRRPVRTITIERRIADASGSTGPQVTVR
jgi:hypothetical protein